MLNSWAQARLEYNQNKITQIRITNEYIWIYRSFDTPMCFQATRDNIYMLKNLLKKDSNN